MYLVTLAMLLLMALITSGAPMIPQSEEYDLVVFTSQFDLAQNLTADVCGTVTEPAEELVHIPLIEYSKSEENEEKFESIREYSLDRRDLISLAYRMTSHSVELAQVPYGTMDGHLSKIALSLLPTFDMTLPLSNAFSDYAGSLWTSDGQATFIVLSLIIFAMVSCIWGILIATFLSMVDRFDPFEPESTEPFTIGKTQFTFGAAVTLGKVLQIAISSLLLFSSDLIIAVIFASRRNVSSSISDIQLKLKSGHHMAIIMSSILSAVLSTSILAKIVDPVKIYSANQDQPILISFIISLFSTVFNLVIDKHEEKKAAATDELPLNESSISLSRYDSMTEARASTVQLLWPLRQSVAPSLIRTLLIEAFVCILAIIVTGPQGQEILAAILAGISGTGFQLTPLVPLLVR